MTYHLRDVAELAFITLAPETKLGLGMTPREEILCARALLRWCVMNSRWPVLRAEDWGHLAISLPHESEAVCISARVHTLYIVLVELLKNSRVFWHDCDTSFG